MPERRAYPYRRTREPLTQPPPPAAGPAAAEADAAAMNGAGADPAEVDRLVDELRTAQSESAEHLALLVRERAEFQNYRRRTTEEREREAGLAGDYLLRKVITIADDFDRAMEAMPSDLAGNPWTDGIGAIDRKLRVLLESEGVRPIEALGRPFDPREHEAVASLPGTGRPDGEVVAEAQRGYRIRDRILRPALVAVAVGGEPSEPPEPGAGQNGAPAKTRDVPTDHTTN